MKTTICGLVLLLLMIPTLFFNELAHGYETLDDCMQRTLGTARDDMTIGELRRLCQGQMLLPDVPPARENPVQQSQIVQQNDLSTIESKLAVEENTEDLSYTLTPHRRNYLMPIAYNSSPNKSVYKGTDEEDIDLDKTEVKLQVSLKYKLIDDFFDKNIDLYIAYTNLSYWQAYNEQAVERFPRYQS